MYTNGGGEQGMEGSVAWGGSDGGFRQRRRPGSQVGVQGISQAQEVVAIRGIQQRRRAPGMLRQATSKDAAAALCRVRGW